MKTHVIQLDSNDDFISIRDKISWVKAPRILIVWPDSGRIRLLDMEIQLIAKKSDNLGAQLAFVCDDPLILQVCNGLGIQVFSSIPEAQRRPWRRPKKNRRLIIQNIDKKSLAFFKDSKSSFLTKRIELMVWQRGLIFTAGVIAFIVVLGLFIPSANVQLNPKTETFKITIAARANPSISSVNLSGSIPATVLVNEVSLVKEDQSSGIIRIPEAASDGDVVFRNLTDQKITIPAGVIVRTTLDPIIRFRTDSSITLEPGVDSEKIVKVTCLSAGVIGNVPAGSIQAVEGEIGGNVLVTNLTGMTGGMEIKTFAPSENDYARAKQKLMEEIAEKAFQKFEIEHPEAFLLPKKTLELIEIIQERHFPEIGIPGDRFKLEIVAKFSIWEIKQSDILPVAENAISLISKDNFIAVGDGIRMKVVADQLIEETGSLNLSIEADRDMEPVIDKLQIFQLISGKDIQQATLLVKQNYNLSSNPVIETMPAFWKRLPFLPFRLNLMVGS